MYRHTKNGKVQVVPLCSKMVSILREYMTIRKGEPEEYLFCNQYGEMLSENALRLAIAHYNRSLRGVEKTSIHLFRHTFARKCGFFYFNKCLWLYKQKIKSHHSSARSAINLTSLTARAS